jgi:hypothetical protein
MKKTFFIFFVFITMISLVTTTASAAPTAMLTQTAELGQLKVCKVAGSGVVVGTSFAFRVNGSNYSVPAGPADRNGYCILAGQYPVNSEITIEEIIPDGYYVSRIEVKPDRTVSKDTAGGIVTVRIVSGVIEAIFTNKVAGSPTPTRTPTSVHTSTPRPTKTPPSCDPNCTATPTPIAMGRLQICKEAEGSGVSGSFTFRFETRSRSVPVGACAGLIAVNAGTLTITETAQAGYSVADIYTIPADRLISKDLNGGSAQVRIVEGTAASQTIVIFRNRKLTIPPTITDTPPPTEMACGPLDGPVVKYADFTKVSAGESVEGLGKVADDLNIDADNGTAVRVIQGTQPEIYSAPNDSGSINGGLAEGGGFSDQDSQAARRAHLYTFTFDTSGRDTNTSRIWIKNFSLHMLDYGDWNPTLSTSHYASMTAYDVNDNMVSSQELNYTTPALELPRTSSRYGNLDVNGDAFAPWGQPGNWVWSVSGEDIARVVLEFGEGYDPDIAFDNLSFTVCKTSNCQWISTDYSGVPVGQSVQGLGTVAEHLNIVANNGIAKRLMALQAPLSYESPNKLELIINGGLVPEGGFSDVSTQAAREPHQYTFTFASGVSIKNFSLHMLDYGDWNPTLSTNHYASMTAYDDIGNEVSKQELSYTTPPEEFPRSSSLYGNLYINGDAFAPWGQPGNWVWNVSGSGIVRVVLEFGEGHDPDIAFDSLSFTRECADCKPISADFNSIPIGQSVEGIDSVAPDLNIEAKGTALHVVERASPTVYVSPNELQSIAGIINGGLVAEGGFSDVPTQTAREPHQYTFTFAPGSSVTNFSLHMLDYGDWNPTLSANHSASMTAYDVNGNVVSQQQLGYETPPEEFPRSSNVYGDLFLNGDALSPLGMPGNWIWNVSGSEIGKVVLEFGEGHDPEIAFDLLSFTLAGCPISGCPPTVISADFSTIPIGQSVEGLGRVAPYLNIDAKGTALHVVQESLPAVYRSPNGPSQSNGGLFPEGGFSDVTRQIDYQPHFYTFSFDEPITNFSLRMLDFGDWNYNRKSSHKAIMIAYDVNGSVISQQELSYTTLAVPDPRWSDLYGNLRASGDALSALPGEPGNWVWNVAGNGIRTVELRFGYKVGDRTASGELIQYGYDPNMAFDSLSFVACP